MEALAEKLGFDAYSRRARLRPALLVALPIGLAVFAWFPQGLPGGGTLAGCVAWGGLTTLLVQLGRDLGKRKEPTLYARWGGKPTTRSLRHRDTPNAVVLARQHQKLGALLRTKLPTREEEVTNPRGADDAYEACAVYLRENTRDTSRFRLIFEENINYGYRRNLWGMKPLALALVLTSLPAIVGQLVLSYVRRTPPHPAVVAAGLLDLVLLGLWLFWFTPEWVKLAAESYAERLLAACEVLPTAVQTTVKKGKT